MKKYWAIKDGYLANRDGNIYNLNWKRTGTMRKVKQHKQTAGYLYFNKNNKPYLVHRFIAELFLPNPNNLPEINHKDENKLNNCVDNLEWCTHKYNMNYGKFATRKGCNWRFGKSWNKGTGDVNKKVFQYTLYGEFVKEWESSLQIENELGYNKGCIVSCCKGELKTSKNYIWRWEKKKPVYYKTITQYTLNGDFIAEYPSIKEAAKALGLKRFNNIYHCCSGRADSAYGFIWKKTKLKN